MTIIHRVDPPIELETPKGHAWCHFLVWTGMETDLSWVCFQADGQIWRWPNQDVRAVRNISAWRDNPEKPSPRSAVP